jgi:hypothetical protein
VDFVDLKRAWEECDRKLDAGIHLNVGILRSTALRDGDSASKAVPHYGIDYGAPIVVVQKHLKLLRVERSRTRKWMLWLSLLACILLIFLGNKNLFGVTAQSLIETAVFSVAVALGLFVVAARIKRSALDSEFDCEEMIGKFQATLLRLLHRRGVLRG